MIRKLGQRIFLDKLATLSAHVRQKYVPLLLVTVLVVAVASAMFPVGFANAAPAANNCGNTSSGTAENCDTSGTVTTGNQVANTSTSSSGGNSQCSGGPGGFWGVIAGVSSTITTGSLNWILCPMISYFLGSFNFADNIINSLLTTPISQYFDYSSPSSSGYGIHQAWLSFRDISLGLIVAAALVMIISQALSIEIMSAYTIRKVLPRLLFAAVFLALSWNVLEFFVSLSNDLGLGMMDLIYTPFKSLGVSAGTNTFANTQMLQGLSGGANTVAGLGFIGAVLIAANVLDILMILIFVGIAVIGALIAFGVLVFRQMLVVFLLIVSPVAIACYILPNTRRGWDVWRDAFVSVLIVFPIISAMIAAGRVFAAISLNSTSYQSAQAPLAGIIAIVAYIAPYLLITQAFRFAGGVMATLTGLSIAGHQGLTGMASRFNSNRFNNKLGRRMAGEQPWKGNTPFARGINSAYRSAYTFGQANNKFQYATDSGYRKASSSLFETSDAAIQATLKKNPSLMELAKDDDANFLMFMGSTQAGLQTGMNYLRTQMAAKGMGSAEIDKSVNGSLAKAQAVGLFSKEHSIAAMDTMTKYKSRAVAAGDWKILQEGIDNIAGGNSVAAADLSEAAAFNSRSAGGRLDLGGRWTAQDPTKLGVAARAKGSKATDNEIKSYMTTLDGMGRGDIQTLMRGHDNQYKSISKTLDFFKEYGDDDQKKLAATRAVELQKGLANGVISGTGQGEVNKYLSNLLGPKYDYSSIDMPGDVVKAFGITDANDVARVKADARAYIYDSTPLGMRGFGTTGGAGTGSSTPPAGGAPPPPSDRRLKRNVNYLARTADGIRLYSFQYFWSKQVYVGVIAQDIIKAHPEAVLVDSFGFYRVNYAILGLEMITFEQWVKQNSLRSNKAAIKLHR